jgi:hypothetical protein
VTVLYQPGLTSAAEHVADLYPLLRRQLEQTFSWRLDFRPTVVLTGDGTAFRRTAGSNLYVAFAVPEKRLVVIDYSRMNRDPFTVEATLKHEMCHLLLHHHLEGADFPKWLDEGVCQWISDGVTELATGTNPSILHQAVLSHTYLTLDELRSSFPADEKSLQLAYEESKGFVEYLNREFGRKSILELLDHLKNGDELEAAVRKTLSISFEELESRWVRRLRERNTWIAFLIGNLYQILFFLAALITVYGFARLLLKKRHYEDDEAA